ncbi:unnamed protein product [Peniophora sp. CBMAI 1063]|nr:unnamed protein product [Peniophora sp. CBMAI 1063]
MDDSNATPWDRLARARLTPRQASETLNSHRLRVEDDIAALQRALSYAKELRNASTPFLTLPDEVILEVLLALRDLYYPSSTSSDFSSTVIDPTWDVCTTLCRRIRSIALSSPLLFTRLSTRVSTWSFIDRCMDLSGSLDLHLEITEALTVHEYPAVHQSLTRHGHRIADVSLKVTRQTIFRFTPMLTYMANARQFALSCEGPGPGTLFSLALAQPWLPNLLTLTMIGIHIDFRPSIADNLLELRLQDVVLHEQGEEHSLVSILQRVTRLRRLALVNVNCQRIAAGDQPPQSDIFLPNSLCYLEYASSTHFNLLHRLHPSPSVHVYIIHTTVPTDSKRETRSLIQVLQAWLGNENRPTTVEVGIRYNTAALEARISYWKSQESRVLGRTPDFELVRYVDEDFHIRDLLLGITHGLRSNSGTLYADVADITFNVEWEYPLLCCMNDWLECISPLNALRALRFTGPRTLIAPPHLSLWPEPNVRPLWMPARLFAEDREPMGDVRVLLIWLTERSARGLALPKLSVPAHMAVALDEMEVETSSETTDWRRLVTNLHVDYRA